MRSAENINAEIKPRLRFVIERFVATAAFNISKKITSLSELVTFYERLSIK